jgi:hypothetical protein
VDCADLLRSYLHHALLLLLVFLFSSLFPPYFVIAGGFTLYTAVLQTSGSTGWVSGVHCSLQQDAPHKNKIFIATLYRWKSISTTKKISLH